MSTFMITIRAERHEVAWRTTVDGAPVATVVDDILAPLVGSSGWLFDHRPAVTIRGDRTVYGLDWKQWDMLRNSAREHK